MYETKIYTVDGNRTTVRHETQNEQGTFRYLIQKAINEKWIWLYWSNKKGCLIEIQMCHIVKVVY